MSEAPVVPLWIRMRRFAETASPDVAAELREKADALEAASDYSNGPKHLLGCWARARRAWCNASGEPLI